MHGLTCSLISVILHLSANLKMVFITLICKLFLHLHARDLDFTATVLKARHFLEASNAKTKKSVRILNQTNSDATWQPLLDGFQRMLTATFGQNKRAGTPPQSRSSSPAQQRSQSPAAQNNQSFAAGAQNFSGRNRVQSPRRTFQAGNASAFQPAVRSRPGFVSHMQQQSQPCLPGISFRLRVPQQQQSFVAKSPSAPRRFTQPYQVAYFSRTSYVARLARRLPTGCHVCG